MLDWTLGWPWAHGCYKVLTMAGKRPAYPANEATVEVYKGGVQKLLELLETSA